MNIRAYHHGDEPVSLYDIEELTEAQLARVPLQTLYHMAADLDDAAANAFHTCRTLQDMQELRAQFLECLDAQSDEDPQEVVVLVQVEEEQRIDQHNHAIMRRLLRQYETQQSRIQVRLSQARREAAYEG